jgi:hypothetical protein
MVMTDQTVSGGQVTVTDQAVGNYEVGLRFSPSFTTMPLNGNYGNGEIFIRKKRIVKARLYVYQSLGQKCNNRDLPDRNYDIDNFDESPEPITKVHSLEETTNWQEDPLYLTISQTDPLPFTVLALDLKLEAE